MITYKQLTLAEIFEDCQNNFDNDKCRFLSLLDEAITLMPFLLFFTFTPASKGLSNISFIQLLKALLIQRIFSSQTCTLLIVFLKYS